MDWLLGRYADANLARLDDAGLDKLERLLALPDPDLQVWIMTGASAAENELSGLVADIRDFHGLAATRGDKIL